MQVNNKIGERRSQCVHLRWVADFGGIWKLTPQVAPAVANSRIQSSSINYKMTEEQIQFSFVYQKQEIFPASRRQYDSFTVWKLEGLLEGTSLVTIALALLATFKSQPEDKIPYSSSLSSKTTARVRLRAFETAIPTMSSSLPS